MHWLPLEPKAGPSHPAASMCPHTCRGLALRSTLHVCGPPTDPHSPTPQVGHRSMRVPCQNRGDRCRSLWLAPLLDARSAFSAQLLVQVPRAYELHVAVAADIVVSNVSAPLPLQASYRLPQALARRHAGAAVGDDPVAGPSPACKGPGIRRNICLPHFCDLGRSRARLTAWTPRHCGFDVHVHQEASEVHNRCCRRDLLQMGDVAFPCVDVRGLGLVVVVVVVATLPSSILVP